MLRWQIKLQKILLPYFALCIIARHLCKFCRTIEPDCSMAKLGKSLQVASRTATQIQYGRWCIGGEVSEQRGDVLADIMRARAFPEGCSTLVVMLQRRIADMPQVLRA